MDPTVSPPCFSDRVRLNGQERTQMNWFRN